MPFNDPAYLDITLGIIKTEIQSGRTVAVLQLKNGSRYSEYYSSRLLNFFHRQNPAQRFNEDIVNLGVQIIHEDSNLLKNMVNPNLLLSNQEFQVSLKSTLITLFSDSIVTSSRKVRNVQREIQQTSLKVYELTRIYLNNYPTTKILVPNGRFADQKAFYLACVDQIIGQKSIYFFEKGFTGKTYYLGEYSLHDRVKMQASIISKISTSRKIDASLWFHSRERSDLANEFNRAWEKSHELDSDISSSKIATLFDSSADEFESLGPDWHTSFWEDQWQAFAIVAQYLSRKGFKIELRLHPNAINKSRAEKSRLRENVAKFQEFLPHARIFSATSKVSSYDLIKRSDLIVVWNSTVGIEASFRSKPVVHLQASEWDLSIPVLQLKDASEVEGFEMRLPKPNPEQALNYIAGRLSLDNAVTTNEYSEKYRTIESQSFIFRFAKNIAGGRGRKNILLVTFKSLFPISTNSTYILFRKLYFKIRIWTMQ